MTITSLNEMIDFSLQVLKDNPERDYATARQKMLRGELRRFPVLRINSQFPGDTREHVNFQCPVLRIDNQNEYNTAADLNDMLKPLYYLNPVHLCFSLGASGAGTLVTCFGIPLDPKAQNSPAYHRNLDELLTEPFPEPGETGLMPEIKKRINVLKDQVPDSIKIRLPDTQGPFNLAHLLIGDECFLAPLTEAKKYHEFMSKLTDFYIESIDLLLEWIGGKYLSDPLLRLRECSTNMVSTEFYHEYILPYDLRVASHFPHLEIHPCSGSHVFHETLENIPNVFSTEAGYVKQTAAGYTTVTEALQALQDRPIVLTIGQELPEGKEFEFIKNDIDAYENNYRLSFGYTGMYWKEEDTLTMLNLHRQVDEYWEKKYKYLYK